jgi:hypothetical protein
LDKDNKFHLHKQNNFLKMARVLFRYHNNLDIIFYKDNYIVEIAAYNKPSRTYFSTTSSNNNVNNNLDSAFAQDRTAMIKYSELKSMPIFDKQRNTEFTSKEISEYKKFILSFNEKILEESLVDTSKFLITGGEFTEKKFNILANIINKKLYEMIDQNFTEKGCKFSNVCSKIREFIIFYNELKENLSKNNNSVKFFELLNIEIILQCYRHANRDEFSSQGKQVQYVLAFMSIMSYYQELQNNFAICYKKFLQYLINKK